jgi:hypothetical protein
MMKREAYPAAKAISATLHAYFARLREKAHSKGIEQIAHLPDADDIEAVIDTAFWASLRREEGHLTRISLAFLPVNQAQHPLVFERPLALSPPALTRIALAVERPGLHLGVWREQSGLCIWGATRGIPLFCFVVEVAEPGLLVIKHHSGGESRKFINVAVLEGDQIKLVEERSSARSAPPPVLKSLLQLDTSATGPHFATTMLQLAVSMREHGRGGLLLIVPADTEAWRTSIIQPVPYAISAQFNERAEDDPAIAAVGGLTAVDGAVLLNSRYEVLGFGAKIVQRKGRPRVEQVMVTEPIQGALPVFVHPDELGGTRHLSAAQFVHDQRDAVALVASQNGRFTAFEWSTSDSMVRAHRVESLLL